MKNKTNKKEKIKVKKIEYSICAIIWIQILIVYFKPFYSNFSSYYEFLFSLRFLFNKVYFVIFSSILLTLFLISPSKIILFFSKLIFLPLIVILRILSIKLTKNFWKVFLILSSLSLIFIYLFIKKSPLKYLFYPITKFKKIMLYIRKIRVRVFVYGFSFLLFYVVLYFNNSQFILLAMILIAITTTYNILVLYCWTIYPAYFLEVSLNKAIEKINIEEQYEKYKQAYNQYEKSGKWKKEEGFLALCKVIEFIKEKIEYLPNSLVLLGKFYFEFLICLFFCIFAFSFEFYGLEKYIHGSFNIFESSYNLLDFFHFSLANMITMDFSLIKPSSEIAKLYVITENIVSILLITLLILSFSIITRQKVKESSERIVRRLSTLSENIKDLIEKFSGKTIEEIELTLKKENKKIIKFK